jgi:hypothetical protein
MKGCLGLHICVIFTVSRREYLEKKWPAGIVLRRSTYEFKIILINTLVLKVCILHIHAPLCGVNGSTREDGVSVERSCVSQDVDIITTAPKPTLRPFRDGRPTDVLWNEDTRTEIATRPCCAKATECGAWNRDAEVPRLQPLGLSVICRDTPSTLRSLHRTPSQPTHCHWAAIRQDGGSRGPDNLCCKSRCRTMM